MCDASDLCTTTVLIVYYCCLWCAVIWPAISRVLCEQQIYIHIVSIRTYLTPPFLFMGVMMMVFIFFCSMWSLFSHACHRQQRHPAACDHLCDHLRILSTTTTTTTTTTKLLFLMFLVDSPSPRRVTRHSVAVCCRCKSLKHSLKFAMFVKLFWEVGVYHANFVEF